MQHTAGSPDSWLKHQGNFQIVWTPFVLRISQSYTLNQLPSSMQNFSLRIPGSHTGTRLKFSCVPETPVVQNYLTMTEPDVESWLLNLPQEDEITTVLQNDSPPTSICDRAQTIISELSVRPLRLCPSTSRNYILGGYYRLCHNANRMFSSFISTIYTTSLMATTTFTFHSWHVLAHVIQKC